MYVYVYVYVCMCVCVHVYVCMGVYVCACVCDENIHCLRVEGTFVDTSCVCVYVYVCACHIPKVNVQLVLARAYRQLDRQFIIIIASYAPPPRVMRSHNP